MKMTVFFGGCVLTLAAFAERIEMKTSSARCSVETLGARIVSYSTAGQGEMLWNDSPAQISGKEWLHGGIPVCWPWFSKNAEGVFHGYAWKRPFNVVSRSESSERSEAVLLLETSEATLTYTVTLDDASLKLKLVTRNSSKGPYRFTAALHPFFKVGERDKTVLHGVRQDPFAVTSAIDGNVPVAKGKRKVCRISDPVLGRTLSLSGENTDGVCTWNPGSDYAGVPGHLPADAWRRFVCVEPTVGFPGMICLKSGESHSFECVISASTGTVVK